MTIDEQKLELDRQRLVTDRERLRLERRKTAIEAMRFHREGRFLTRNSAAIIASSVTLLSIVVTGFSLYHTSKANVRNEALVKERNLQATEESYRKWKFDAANFIFLHKDTIMSPELAGKYPLRAIMLLSFPNDITESLYDGLAAQAPNPAIAAFWRTGQRLIEAQKLAEVNVPEAANPVASTGQVVLSASGAGLSAQLNGAARRAVSNALIERYSRDQRGTMALLVAAIVPPGEPNTYRVNLYILVTLARIKGGWTGTQDERAAVLSIANSSERNDPTYRKWADQAIAAQVVP